VCRVKSAVPLVTVKRQAPLFTLTCDHSTRYSIARPRSAAFARWNVYTPGVAGMPGGPGRSPERSKFNYKTRSQIDPDRIGLSCAGSPGMCLNAARKARRKCTYCARSPRDLEIVRERTWSDFNAADCALWRDRDEKETKNSRGKRPEALSRSFRFAGRRTTVRRRTPVHPVSRASWRRIICDEYLRLPVLQAVSSWGTLTIRRTINYRAKRVADSRVKTRRSDSFDGKRKQNETKRNSELNSITLTDLYPTIAIPDNRDYLTLHACNHAVTFYCPVRNLFDESCRDVPRDLRDLLMKRTVRRIHFRYTKGRKVKRRWTVCVRCDMRNGTTCALIFETIKFYRNIFSSAFI